MLLTAVALMLQTQALAFPSGLVLDSAGNVLVADRCVYKVFRIDARTGAMTVIAGPAAAAQMNMPFGLAIAENGNLVFSDAGIRRVRRIVMRSGVIRSITP